MKANRRERETAIASCSGTYWIVEVAATAAGVEDAIFGGGGEIGAASMITVRVPVAVTPERSVAT